MSLNFHGSNENVAKMMDETSEMNISTLVTKYWHVKEILKDDSNVLSLDNYNNTIY